MSSHAARQRARRVARAAVVPPDPPLVTLHDALKATNEHVASFVTGLEGDPVESFREWRTAGWADLAARPVGTAEDLSFAYMNANNAESFVTSLNKRIQARAGATTLRADAASRNVLAASVVIHGALLTHLRNNNLYEWGTCALARTAIELAARAVHVARGTGHEATTFNRGDTIRASDAMSAFDALVAVREPSAATPTRVYAWLCHFTHMDVTAMNGVGHEQAYAALAYVCWATAIAAEVVGGERFAVLPAQSPATLPW